MFRALQRRPGDKAVVIEDTATEVALFLDIDDVNPEDVTPEKVERIIKALNTEFYS